MLVENAYVWVSRVGGTKSVTLSDKGFGAVRKVGDAVRYISSWNGLDRGRI